MGIETAVDALWFMDELYPQNGGDPWAVRTQLVMQLAAPPPYDLDSVDLAEYKGVRPPFDRWAYVAEVCGRISDQLLDRCVDALQADVSPSGQQARTTIETWRDARSAGDKPPTADVSEPDP
jgi:hypothetical protein